MSTAVYIVVAAAIGIASMFGIAWLGLQIPPRPFPDIPEQTPALETVELPPNLPTPAIRYYKTIVKDQVPVIESAIITGRGSIRVKGITFPSRFRFAYLAGRGYRHYIEATLFGFPVMTVNEYYLDGKARMELPVGTIENEPKIDMAANLGLWAESIWMPSIFITDPRVHFRAIDDTTVLILVPFGEDTDTLIATFDHVTGLISKLEAMRWREPTDETKIAWRNEPLEWIDSHGIMIPSPAATTWIDEGTPWAAWRIDNVAYNVDVSEILDARR